MGKIYIPGEKKISGPWFIGQDDLEELDEIFEFAYQKILNSIKKYKNIETTSKNLQNNLRENNLAYDNIFNTKPFKKVELTSKNGKKLIDDTLKGILRDSKLIDFKPETLVLEITTKINIYYRVKISKRFEGELSYEVDFFDQECSEEIIYNLENWIEKKQPKKAFTIWNKLGGLFAIVSFLFLLINSLSIYNEELPNPKIINQNEINKIIESGVNEKNEFKAIELLLKNSIDYKPKDIKPEIIINTKAIRYTIISLIIFIFSIFTPITIIGIGEHKKLLKKYKFYTSFVIITIPTIFILPSIIDLIKNFLKI